MLNHAESLYAYLLRNPDRFVTQEEICKNLPEYFPATNPKNATTLNKKIWESIQVINNSIDEFSLIVVIKKRSYKVATQEEVLNYLNCEYSKVVKKFKRLNNIKTKMRLDGVADLTSLLNNDQLSFLNTTVKDLNSYGRN